MTSSRGKVSKYESVGFKPGVTISNVVSSHINDLYLCCDIGKFFNNVKWNRFIEQSLFYEFYKDQPAEYQFMPGLLDALMGPIMHNSVLPTGAPYSPAISNFFLIDFTNNMKSNFIKDMEDINPNYADNEYKITRYADDITISCKEHPDGDDGLLNIDAAKVIEKYLNEKHLHLKYSKTKVFDRRKTNVPILGYSIPKKINDNEIVQINTTSAFRRNFINIVRNNWTLAHLNEKEMGILSYYLKNTHFYNVFDVCANLGSYINEFDRKRKNDVYSLKIETSYSIFAHFERNREINDKVLKETVYNFLYEIYNTDPLFNIMDCIETTYFTDFNDSYIIHFKKPLTYETIWNGARCQEEFCTYAEAESGAPEGYRLPTLEEAELFCKLYDVSYKDKELKLKSNDGTIFTAKISDKNSYAYVTYPYQMHIWIDSELVTYFKKGICCHNFKTPVIESRSIYLKGCALYVKKQQNEVQEQS
jgi:hypothetical protein